LFLDDATSRISVVIEQGQKAGDIKANIPPMDLARFLLNSLYGAIFRSKTETTERPSGCFDVLHLSRSCSSVEQRDALRRGVSLDASL
jgi:hypothetical protein